MKIIADQQIPYLSYFFGDQGDLITLPSEKISANTVKDAEVLLVRSTTPINKALVSNTSVRFIGSATAGIDHMDTEFLNEAGIAWACAPGCNAKAVADYVLLSVAHLRQAFTKKSLLHAGIIGVGHVGQRVSTILKQMGFSVILNDPPRAHREKDFISTPLDKFYDLDLICLHTPLTTTGPYPTKHLIDAKFLSKLNPKCILLNAGRGACIDSQALKKSPIKIILDVWENEPEIDIELAQSAFIATPHIAGYSEPAKYRATQQLFETFYNRFNANHLSRQQKPLPKYVEIDALNFNWIEKTIAVENLMTLSDKFKAALKQNPDKISETFNHFRKNYQFRPGLKISHFHEIEIA